MGQRDGRSSVDGEHRRPPGTPDLAVTAAGRFSEALERLERARGALYDFHQLVGRADALLDEVVEALDSLGRDALAAEVRRELIGRNVLSGRWTYQVVEEFDDGYYAVFRSLEEKARRELVGGRRHVHEAEMKERRRTAGHPGHEALPED
ncbi:hypothetical protein [Peterkaempfera bronchialis]|uniref:Uncharacterized protein n=1 Tax=Peterkaempfera bronchialis TaxID=2126346 RepID=A0A345T3H6_9ACTN|nr:hypothetical protein [Peterkaempfera bronchialis]AXI80531.1 hypothetical protein C7M71_027220 [Peterkaempfera bronchialis]